MGAETSFQGYLFPEMKVASMPSKPILSIPVNHKLLFQVGCELFEAAGVAPDIAVRVVNQLIDANLCGHDSHGIMRIPRYTDDIKASHIKLDGRIEEVPLSAHGFTQIKGGWQIGQVVAEEAIEILKVRAKGGVHEIALQETPHIGRLSWYAEELAREGFMSLILVSVAGAGRVAFPNSSQGYLGTNPICFGFPRSEGGPLIFDSGTAYVEGKVRYAYDNGLPVEDGLLIDHQGNPTKNPAVLYEPPLGAILPVGGNQGHKLGVLALSIQLLTQSLSGFFASTKAIRPGTNPSLMRAYDVSALIQDKNAYNDWLTGICHAVSNLSPLEDKKVHLPGEIESQTKAERLKHGIPITRKEWDLLVAAGEKVSLKIREKFAKLNAEFDLI